MHRLAPLVVLFVLLPVMMWAPLDRGYAQGQDTCGNNPLVSQLLARTSQEKWAEWIRKLSGEEPVRVGGETVTIRTRLTSAMFNGAENARAFDYVLEQVSTWYPKEQIEIDEYRPVTSSNSRQVWKNLIVTLPGAGSSEEVIFSAHLDSIVHSGGDPAVSAPGAEDNASGSAALLEAARIFRFYRFERTIRFIWFTGEEQGLLGSKAYVEDHPTTQIVGVINLDMYGYDPDNEACFELHVGSLAASDRVGQCFDQALKAYSPNLKRDYVTNIMPYSDHASFWGKRVGAVEVLENHIEDNQPGGCTGSKESPFYHTPRDTIDKMNLPVGFDITRAGLAALAGMAHPLGEQTVQPTATAQPTRTLPRVTNPPLPSVQPYRTPQPRFTPPVFPTPPRLLTPANRTPLPTRRATPTPRMGWNPPAWLYVIPFCLCGGFILLVGLAFLLSILGIGISLRK